MKNNKFQRECPICKKIIKSGNYSLTSFEEMFERHLKKHKLSEKKRSRR
ncbi:MAG: hypothetical protein KKF56_05590 [Nanoarchaeota archaeon]|nr:hypothetical protein [Nanoarchaeota archaeon]